MLPTSPPPPSGPPGHYRRPLPEGLIAFSSEEGRQIFREALDAGYLNRWFSLAEHFHTQSEPAFCALGSLVTVLNALAIDPGRTWKGPWRWYSEELLDCCEPLDRVREHGISLPSFVCLARCNGATAVLRRPDTHGVEVLRADLTGPGHVISAFGRAALGQTGDGHYSPLGGWHPGRDLVLVLDVARFKYPPFWVPIQWLWEAMIPPDPATGRSRGWVVLDRDPRPRNLHVRLVCDRPGWREALGSLPAAFGGAEDTADPLAAAVSVARALPPALSGVLTVEAPARALIASTALYRALAAVHPDPAAAALLLLAAPAELLPQGPALRADVPVELLHEADALLAQLRALGGGGTS